MRLRVHAWSSRWPTRNNFFSWSPLPALVLGCKPEVGQAPSLVTDYALLAVRGEPPEAKPGADVVYSFLLASPAGTVTDATAGWDVCETPKPPAENNSVASACNPPAPGPTTGQTFETPVLTNACTLFGPIAPPAFGGPAGDQTARSG